MYDFSFICLYFSFCISLVLSLYFYLASTFLIIPKYFALFHSLPLTLFLFSFMVYFLVAGNLCFCLASFPFAFKVESILSWAVWRKRMLVFEVSGDQHGGSGNFNCVTKNTTNRAIPFKPRVFLRTYWVPFHCVPIVLCVCVCVQGNWLTFCTHWMLYQVAAAWFYYVCMYVQLSK